MKSRSHEIPSVNIGKRKSIKFVTIRSDVTRNAAVLTNRDKLPTGSGRRTLKFLKLLFRPFYLSPSWMMKPVLSHSSQQWSSKVET